MAELGRTSNVAQFISFSPQGDVRHSAIRGCSIDEGVANFGDGVALLLEQAAERSVRVRSFHPDRPSGQPFTKRPLGSQDEVSSLVHELWAQGLYVIVNESIDINDGGVSGVLHGPVIEFAPKSVPRCVEEPGVCSLERASGIGVLETVYGRLPLLDVGLSDRTEFSVHPQARGFAHQRVIVWESERLPVPHGKPVLCWPNRFSRHIGDKVFGLLVAHNHAFAVPRCRVWTRHLPGFEFGRVTGFPETWLRSCPEIPTPGRYPTYRGWQDPFKEMQRIDPDGTVIASFVQQDGVNALYSGSAIIDNKQRFLIEGVPGYGDEFMLSRQEPVGLPQIVTESVQDCLATLAESLQSDAKIEWSYDGERLWLLQLHLVSGGSLSIDWIYPGSVNTEFINFDVQRGLDDLYRFVQDLDANGGLGVALVGNVGLTSHMCDVLRKMRIPSRLVPEARNL